MFQTANLRIFFGIYADVDKKIQTSISVTIATVQTYTVFSYFCQLFSNHPEKKAKKTLNTDLTTTKTG